LFRLPHPGDFVIICELITDAGAVVCQKHTDEWVACELDIACFLDGFDGPLVAAGVIVVFVDFLNAVVELVLEEFEDAFVDVVSAERA